MTTARWSARRIGLVSAVSILVGLGTARSAAAQAVLFAEDDPAADNSFTLDFGEAGGVASANITTTTFTLRIDEAAHQARFASYSQRVEPLILPGGFSTGNIYVEIVPGSSSGTYDPATQDFSTSEQYAIYFDGDLSLFGLTSPVVLPSASNGTVDLFTDHSGAIALQWHGVGQLQNPQDPQNPIVFTYTCSVNTQFQLNAEAGDTNCDQVISADDIDPFVVALLSPGQYPVLYPGCDMTKADVNNDGVVDNSDIDGFVTLLID